MTSSDEGFGLNGIIGELADLHRENERLRADLAEALALLRDDDIAVQRPRFAMSLDWWQRRDALLARHPKDASDG